MIQTAQTALANGRNKIHERSPAGFDGEGTASAAMNFL